MRLPTVAFRGICSWSLSAVVTVAGSAQTNTPKPAIPLDPIPAIVEALQLHSVVALGDAHGNEQAQAFLKSLVLDPRFAAAANDILVEFGNARYQHLADRFVRGGDVPLDSLRMIWQNTTIPNEIPVDEEFFHVVRTVNASLPKERQLRVLLGDPPIDWSSVHKRDDHFKCLAMRDSYPAALIQLEVLAKQRRALVVYGQLHFQRKNVMSNLEMHDWRMQTIVSLVESATPTKVFTIWNFDDELVALQPDVASWRAPSLAIIRGTTLGAADITAFTARPVRMSFPNGRPAQVPRDQWRSLRAEDQFDAVLYLGRRSALTRLPMSPKICSDSAYIAERLRRIALTGVPPVEAERVRDLCAVRPSSSLADYIPARRASRIDPVRALTAQ